MSNPVKPTRLEDIICIQAYFAELLCEVGVKDEDLCEEFNKLCEKLRQGKESNELRKITVKTLLADGYNQYEIAKLLNVSVRTVGRIVKKIADELHHPRFWKRGLLREGKLRERKMSEVEMLEKIVEDIKSDKSGSYALFLYSVLHGNMSDFAQKHGSKHENDH